MRKNKDILVQKNERLAKLNQASDRAMSVVTQTINSLLSVNKEIENEQEEIRETQNQLSVVKGSLDEQYKTNTKVVNKFKSFLED